jgi:hypothetical protein
MARHWAIAIGISDYASMEPLPYAKRDAGALQEFLSNKAAFDRVLYFSDDSPNVTLDEGITVSTQPTFANLKQFFQVRFATPFLQPEDTLWFFFSGHGLNYGSRDYLLPSDADPHQAETSAIALDDLVQCLKQSGSRNVVLLLDACHTPAQKFGQGFGTDPDGVITIFGSDYGQIAGQSPTMGKGLFAHALIEGMQALSEFRNATLEHLYFYLRDRLPKLSRQAGLPAQLPRLSLEPPLALAKVAMPHATGRKGLFQNLFLQQQIKSAMKGAAPLAPARQFSISNLAMGAVGLCVLCAGVGYSLNQGANPSDANPTKTATKPAKVVKPVPTATHVDMPPDLEIRQDALARIPRAGKYYAEDPRFSASSREIGKSGARLCIKKIDPGTPAVVSSLSLRNDGFYIDATQERLRLGTVYTEFADNKTRWQRLETNVDETGAMGSCLTSKSRFVLRLAKAD